MAKDCLLKRCESSNIQWPSGGHLRLPATCRWIGYIERIVGRELSLSYGCDLRTAFYRLPPSNISHIRPFAQKEVIHIPQPSCRNTSLEPRPFWCISPSSRNDVWLWPFGDLHFYVSNSLLGCSGRACTDFRDSCKTGKLVYRLGMMSRF